MEKICENCDWKDGDFCPHMLDCKNYSEWTPKRGQMMIKCNECDYCARTRRGTNTRYEYMCKHPDYKYIFGYFEKHRIEKMPRFLGFSKNPYVAPIKTSPAWCPYKKKEAADDKQ